MEGKKQLVPLQLPLYLVLNLHPYDNINEFPKGFYPFHSIQFKPLLSIARAFNTAEVKVIDDAYCFCEISWGLLNQEMVQ